MKKGIIIAIIVVLIGILVFVGVKTFTNSSAQENNKTEEEYSNTSENTDVETENTSDDEKIENTSNNVSDNSNIQTNTVVNEISNNTVNESNIQTEERKVRVYSGCILVLEVHSGGYGYSGQDLGSQSYSEEYDVSEGDVFFEPSLGGVWKLNLESSSSASEILKINKIEENTIEFQANGEEHTAQIGEDMSVRSNFQVMDGINYSYKIKFIKDNQ